MPTSLAPMLIQQFKDNNGSPLVGGQLYTYQAGTSTPIASYTDATGATPNANPVILNSRGEAPFWLTPGLFYKVVLQDAAGVLIWSADQVSGGTLDAGFLQSGANSINRSIASKLTESVSVRDFGAAGDGVTDDTAAFSNAAKGVIARSSINAPENVYIALSPMGVVKIPPGLYLITSRIDVGGRTITWVLDQGAVVVNYNLLNGKIHRPGQRTNALHYGTNDNATTVTFMGGNDQENGAAVTGLTEPSGLTGNNESRDSVTMYVENRSQPATAISTTGSFTATTFTPSTAFTADQVKQFKAGMIIDTTHVPPWAGFLTGWSSSGVDLTVSLWWPATAPATSGIPASGFTCVVNGMKKIWAHNANVFLEPAGYSTRATGFELGSFNKIATVINDAPLNQVWGFDSVSIGPFKGYAAFLARGTWQYAFQISDCEVGVSMTSGGTLAQAFTPNKLRTAIIRTDGSMTMGSTETLKTLALDFLTAGTNKDYDTRFYFSSPISTTTSGQGYLQIFNALTQTAALSPLATCSHDLGTANNLWNSTFTLNLLARSYVGIGTPGQIPTAPPVMDFFNSGGAASDARITVDQGLSTTANKGTMTIFGGTFSVLTDKITLASANLINAATDTAAATAGVGVNQLYRNGSALMVRIV